MSSLELQLRREIIALENELESWKVWYCRTTKCKHYMCQRRNTKMIFLNTMLDDLYNKLKVVHENYRYTNWLGV